MAILTFPSIIPETQNFGIKYNTQISTTTISGITKRVELPGARWGGTMGFKDLTQIELSIIKPFLLELRGSSGTFFFGDIARLLPLNSVTGTLQIETASTAKFVRITYDSPGNQLSPGDYVQVGEDDKRELKLVISSVLVSGNTYDVTIEPMIRRIDYIGLNLVYNNPKGVFFLKSDSQAKWNTRSKAQLADINLDFIEVFL